MQREHGPVGDEAQIERRPLAPGLPAHDAERTCGDRRAPQDDGDRRQVEPAAEQPGETEQQHCGMYGSKSAGTGHDRQVHGRVIGADCAIPARSAGTVALSFARGVGAMPATNRSGRIASRRNPCRCQHRPPRPSPPSAMRRAPASRSPYRTSTASCAANISTRTSSIRPPRAASAFATSCSAGT